MQTFTTIDQARVAAAKNPKARAITEIIHRGQHCFGLATLPPKAIAAKFAASPVRGIEFLDAHEVAEAQPQPRQRSRSEWTEAERRMDREDRFYRAMESADENAEGQPLPAGAF